MPNVMMEAIIQFLRQSDALIHAWTAIVWICAVYLLALGIISLGAPDRGRKFLGGFASSRQVNTLEAALRLLAGLGFMGAAPDLKSGFPAFHFGAILAMSAVAIAFLYRAHEWYAGWAVGFAQKAMPALGALSIALGLIIIWALA